MNSRKTQKSPQLIDKLSLPPLKDNPLLNNKNQLCCLNLRWQY